MNFFLPPNNFQQEKKSYFFRESPYKTSKIFSCTIACIKWVEDFPLLHLTLTKDFNKQLKCLQVSAF